MKDTDIILSAVSRLRPPAILDESELQDMVADVLAESGIPFQREYRAGKGCRVDFMLENGIVLEIKARRRPKSVLIRQLERYAGCECVRAIILISNETAGAPSLINDKPVISVNLKRLWGVAV